MYEVFSSGGGTQSACISALIVQGRLPKPDFMVIADTGYECRSTWDYLDAVIRPAMTAIGVEVHHIGPEWKSIPAHGRDWQSHNEETVLLPMFTNQSGETGKLSGFCSNSWKVEVVNRYLSQTFGITRSQFRKWIGFSLDEWRRVQRMMAGKEYRKGLIRFPMVSDVPMKRFEGILLVERMGWPTPPRSRCKICSNQADQEWLEMKDNRPWELKEAAEVERKIQEPGLFDGGNYCSSGVCFV